MLEAIASGVSRLLGRESSLVRQLRPAYETLLSWSSGGHGIPCSINGIELRCVPRCRQYCPARFDYEPAVAVYLREIVKPDRICFDVGANVGYYVLQFAYWTRPSGRAISLDDFCDAHPDLIPDCLLIDIEGFVVHLLCE